jgi:O-antigen/teichoic acid export membrane protein
VTSAAIDHGQDRQVPRDAEATVDDGLTQNYRPSGSAARPRQSSGVRRSETPYPEEPELAPPRAARERRTFAATPYRDSEMSALRSDPRNASKRVRQLAGIAALLSLATSAAVTTPIPVIPSGLDQRYMVARSAWDARHPVTPRAGVAESRAGRWGLLARIQADSIVRNSLYLILNSGVQAGLGFAFWIVTARLFSTTDVGRASSLISASALIAFFALLGLNSSLIRHLPTALDRDRLISAGLVLVAVGAMVMGTAYVLLTPLISPRLAFVAHKPALAAGFVLLTAAGAVNVLTDSVFIGVSRAGYNALADGGVGGLTKLIAVAALAGTGAYGLFCASGVGSVAAALASLLLMATALHWRPSLRKPVQALRPILKFSGANYAGNILNLLPTLVVPLIVLDRIGAPSAAYYFVSFQLATLLYSTVYAVEQSFLAEGSHAGTVQKALLRRSRRVLMAMCLPACLLVTLASHWILLAFGAKYSEHAAGSVSLLTVAALPIAATNWLLTLLRLAGRLGAIIVSNAVYAVAICGIAWFLAPRGLTAVTAAWPIGALLCALVAGVGSIGAVPRGAPARHRRTDRTRLPPSAQASSRVTGDPPPGHPRRVLTRRG